MSDGRRELPSVNGLLGSAAFRALMQEAPRPQLVELIRRIQQEQRASAEIGAVDAESYAAAVRARLEALSQASLRRVINATGVVLHTNLGRAPLAEEARDAILEAAGGYTNLEYELATGTRGSRYDHCRELLCELTGAPDALVVNNNAGALVLALNTFAAGREVVVSRGELIEIGGSFRVPEILARSGATLREVGATNRVHSADYAEGLSAQTALLLKVHPSNFQMSGFTSEVELFELAHLARARDLLLVHDLGSGLLFDLRAHGFPEEPLPQTSLQAGADLVTLSGDKLLGGPQAGIVLGQNKAIDAMRRNPLCRALRVDKLTLAGLEATLQLYRDPARARERIPVLRMLTLPAAQLRQRAQALETQWRAAGLAAAATDTVALVGGGAFPNFEMASAGVQIDLPNPHQLDQRLRDGRPAVVARITQNRLVLDLRTVDPLEDVILARALIDAATR